MRLSIYDRYVLPRLTHLVMQSPQLAAYRKHAADHARGDVLEIGIGSGLNLLHYGSQVRRVIGIEPSPALARLARGKGDGLRFPLELHVQSAEDLPLADRSVDTALTTWSLCTIPDPARALREVRRVLRPEGHLVFVERGRSSEPRVVAWQDWLTPLWRRCAGGCHLNRPIDKLVRNAGFAIVELKAGYMGRPKVATFMYEGTAKPV
jgi:ubiquinone/menaquinone biosynthesis C-methylase UbiE